MAAHNAGSRKRPRRRIMRAFKINEISAVDVPAQEGAVAVIMKRYPQTDDIEKGAALTTENAGNTHLLSLVGHGGDDINSGMTSWVDEHSHPWVRTEGGDIVIGAAPSSTGVVHTHDIAQMSKLDDVEKRTFTAEQRKQLAKEGKALPDGSFPIVTKEDLQNAISTFGRASNKAQVARHIKKRARALKATDILPTEGVLANLLKNAGKAGEVGTEEETTMTETKKAAEPTVEDLQAQLARATTLAELSDAEKTHLATLKGDEAKAFLAKSAEDRKAEVEKVAKAAQDDDPVAYTTTDGIDIRKSAGEAFIAIAKSNDALRKDNVELRDAREQDALEKRAETELKHLPGDVKTRAAMLKAIDGIDDKAQREAAMNALKAQNEAMATAFTTAGHGGTPAPGSADDELDKLAKAHQEKNPKLTYEAAYAEVTKTERGGELYAKVIN